MDIIWLLDLSPPTHRRERIVTMPRTAKASGRASSSTAPKNTLADDIRAAVKNPRTPPALRAWLSLFDKAAKKRGRV